jgi:hypothetical protein
MVHDVRLAVEGRKKVDLYFRVGGTVPGPDEVMKALGNGKGEASS